MVLATLTFVVTFWMNSWEVTVRTGGGSREVGGGMGEGAGERKVREAGLSTAQSPSHCTPFSLCQEWYRFYWTKACSSCVNSTFLSQETIGWLFKPTQMLARIHFNTKMKVFLLHCVLEC